MMRFQLHLSTIPQNFDIECVPFTTIFVQQMRTIDSKITKKNYGAYVNPKSSIIFKQSALPEAICNYLFVNRTMYNVA